MTDLPLDIDVPDDLPDDKLPAKVRSQLKKVTDRMVNEGNGTFTDDERAKIPPKLMHRAWIRYQEHFEAAEDVRERNARDFASDLNRRAEREKRRREKELND